MENQGLSPEETEQAIELLKQHLAQGGLGVCEHADGCLMTSIPIARRRAYFLFQVAAQAQVANVVSVRIPPENLLEEIGGEPTLDPRPLNERHERPR